jgi:hypothetical protein
VLWLAESCRRKSSHLRQVSGLRASLTLHSLTRTTALPSRPSLPPRQPTHASERSPERPVPALPSRSTTSVETKRALVPPPQRPVRSALSLGFNNKATVEPPPIPSSRPVPGVNGAPPPVPTSSRPNLDAIMASKPKPGAVAQCLICRDFSGPDNHAAKFPRQSLPLSDVGYLASLLCDPFPSATDKARAIFTWLHYNVDYDVANFRAGTIKPSTPEGTIMSGLVCMTFVLRERLLTRYRQYVKAMPVCSRPSRLKPVWNVWWFQVRVKVVIMHLWVLTTHCLLTR